MKKYISFSVMMLLSSTVLAAGFVGPGSTVEISTVKDLKSLKDDTPVVITGFLTRKIKSEHYMFKDQTGEIEVEIDDAYFHGITVTPSDKIKITGEVDKEWSEVSVDASSIELMSGPITPELPKQAPGH